MINAVALESAMTAQAVLSRLARHGFWLDPNQPQAAEWIRQCASRTAPPPRRNGAPALKRFLNSSGGDSPAVVCQRPVVHAFRSRSVDALYARETPTQPLLDVLNLHEPDSRPAVPLEAAAGAPNDSVILDGDQAVGVGPRETSVPLATGGTTRRRGSGGPGAPIPRPRTARTIQLLSRLLAGSR